MNAGATRDMIDPDFYGDYEFLISGHTDAQHVSVVISFADDEGRAGSLAAAATVRTDTDRLQQGGQGLHPLTPWRPRRRDAFGFQ
jgi:hypothetical protein